MVSRYRGLGFILMLVVILVLCDTAEAQRRKRRYRHNPTHPVLLWARTVVGSADLEERRVAAFKLSQYSQPIYQSTVLSTLHQCVSDPDLQIRVFCIRALGSAGQGRHEASVRRTLLNRYENDPSTRNTVVRTLITREDRSAEVHNTLLTALRKAEKEEDRLTLLSYFEQFGNGSAPYVNTMVYLYEKYPDSKTRRSIVKALSEQGKGQSRIIELFAKCATGSDTPLALTCLSGLEAQGKNDARSWRTVEKTLAQSDPDMLIATLDVINDLPKRTNPKVAARLLEIVNDTEDPEIQEKAILALGATGDQTLEIVTALLKVLDNNKSDEASRIAAALSLGEQGSRFPAAPMEKLELCSQKGPSQSFRTACRIGLTELRSQAKSQAKAEPKNDQAE